MPSIDLIHPTSGTPPYNGAEVFGALGLEPVAFTANLAIVTVAALVPEDFHVSLRDEHVVPVDLDSPADFVGLTGNSAQAARMIELADAFRRKGKTVLIGGPFATLCPEMVRDHCDVLVRGELEEVATSLFDDLRRGRWQDEYVGGRGGLESSPIPRWDLYPSQRALSGCVQTSRGCPFECEFCDVIQYVGRRQRHKEVGQVLDELDSLYRLGYRNVFLSDDNLTVYRQRARELLAALGDWNRGRAEGMVGFNTQLSLEIAEDDDMLELCYRAGLTLALVGIETPLEESLRETKKASNLRGDIVSNVRRFYDHGISIESNALVGFDSDGPGAFARQYEFAMETPVPIYLPVALIAPPATPLFARLEAQGRLPEWDVTTAYGTPWWTNIRPAQMTREELFLGLKWLGNNLFAPGPFADRVVRFIELLREQDEPLPPKGLHRPVDMDVANVVRRIGQLGADEAKMLSRLMEAASRKRQAKRHLTRMLLQYMQTRFMYESAGIWEPALVGAEPPS